jgi:two-component system CheB/CheR fusion protein
MPEQLVTYVRSFDILGKDVDKDQQADAVRNAISTLLLDQTGHDFKGYKTRTFFRRVERRMQVRPDPSARGLCRKARVR